MPFAFYFPTNSTAVAQRKELLLESLGFWFNGDYDVGQ